MLDKNAVWKVNLYTLWVTQALVNMGMGLVIPFIPYYLCLLYTSKVVKDGRTFTRLSAEAYSKESGKLIATCMSNYTVLNEAHKGKY